MATPTGQMCRKALPTRTGRWAGLRAHTRLSRCLAATTKLGADMRTLDKTKPWFSVHGDASGAAFEQDGCLFGLDGDEIVVAERAAAVTVGPPAEQPAAAEAPAKKTPGRKKQPAAAEAPASAIDEQIAAQAGA